MESRISLLTLGVADLERSLRFYRDGLGFPTKSKIEDGVIFFTTGGVRLALFPRERLAEDISPALSPGGSGFNGITLAHNVRTREEVAVVLKLAEAAGAKIVKPAQDTFWGGHAGYFTDLDGFYWEIAWGPMFRFAEDGALLFELGDRWERSLAPAWGAAAPRASARGKTGFGAPSRVTVARIQFS